MAAADIPVDLFNPGQVFACLGFLEAAEVLLGDAEGGFDWNDEENTRFRLQTNGVQNPFGIVLQFLAEAEMVVVRPADLTGPWPNGAKSTHEFPASDKTLRKSEGKGFTASALPILLKHDQAEILVSHWLKRNSLQTLKLFAGQQVASQLTANMLKGDQSKKGTQGIRQIYSNISDGGFRDPFNVVCPVGGRFGFDARGGWDSIRIGSSLDKQGSLVEIAPHVELLAAIGLENARPVVISTYQIRYAVWWNCLPITLCRIAMFSPDSFLPRNEYRFFRAHLGEDKQYKKIFFAEEETLS